MRLSDLFFRKKKSNNNNTSLTVLNNGIMKNVTDEFTIHEDIKDLIWVADGIRKNYICDKKHNVFNFGEIKITFSSMQQDEPSLIYTKLPIAEVEDISCVERPPYYPTYSQLTPEQRGVYWRFLSNPYNTKIDIGFVFILYYGLERHLLNGNYEKAFSVILKLRDVHTNKSFQQYSANALILTCLCKQRADLAFEFMYSLDKDYKLQFSENLFILCKYNLDIPLTAKDIMRLAKSFEFSNMNYIKNYPEIFEETLLESIENIYKSESILVSNFITQTEYRKIREQKVLIFANISIIDKNIEIPMFIENFKFKKAMCDLLEITHNQVKSKIFQLRKNGDLEKNKKETKKVVEILCFDEKTEKELLVNLNKTKNDCLSRHFALISLQDFYYKYRNVDNKCLYKCIEYCYIDINSLEQVQKSYYDNEIKRIKQLGTLYSKIEIEKKISEIKTFNGNIPAFRRLAIIFEKQNDYQKAIEICDSAINYYENIGIKSEVDEFKTRKDKLLNKVK